MLLQDEVDPAGVSTDTDTGRSFNVELTQTVRLKTHLCTGIPDIPMSLLLEGSFTVGIAKPCD